jgi:hypothetical protein
MQERSFTPMFCLLSLPIEVIEWDISQVTRNGVVDSASVTSSMVTALSKHPAGISRRRTSEKLVVESVPDL